MTRTKKTKQKTKQNTYLNQHGGGIRVGAVELHSVFPYAAGVSDVLRGAVPLQLARGALEEHLQIFGRISEYSLGLGYGLRLSFVLFEVGLHFLGFTFKIFGLGCAAIVNYI